LIPLTKSLNAKLLLIVVLTVTLSGLLAALRQEWVERQRLEASYDTQLKQTVKGYQRQLAYQLAQRQHLLEAAHGILTQRLGDEDAAPLPESTLVQGEDLAWRSLDGISAVFVHRDSPPDAITLTHIARTRQVWEEIIPLLSTNFSSVYFVSSSRMSRIWPGGVVINHRADHDITQENLYLFANPQNNPLRQPRWVPFYFSDYADIWKLTLVIPVYRQDEFIGVMGGTISGGELLTQVIVPSAEKRDIHTIVFNDKGQLIARSDRHQVGREDPALARYLEQAANGELAAGHISRRQVGGEAQHIGYFTLDNMNWMMALHYPQALIRTKLATTLSDIYINILILITFLSLILYLSIRYFVVQRVRALALATASISQHDWAVRVPQTGQDEISFLGRCINEMLLKINDLIHGLNSNIQQLERANLEARQLLVAIESSTSMVVILNKAWELEYANAQFWCISGYSQADNLVGKHALLLEGNAANTFQLKDIVAQLYKGAAGQHPGFANNAHSTNDWRAEYQATRRDGSHFWITQTISAIFSETGELEYFIAVGHDSTDRKANQERMEHLAYYDQLTGLHNRVLFKDQLRKALNSCQRNNTQFSLMYLDLDHFKRINDTLGHEAGDVLLVEVARRLRTCLREEDIVARLGGDEFAVLLQQVTNPQYAYSVANKIIAALNQPLVLHGKEVVIGVSIGITMAPNDSEDIDSLMKNADLAMYRAKEKGRNKFQFYTADMNVQVEYRLALENDLRRALKNQEFELYYQPVVELHTGRIVSAEALLRWNHPQRGIIHPEAFIPVAEESGLIVPMGKWVIYNACQQAKNIHKALRRPITIAVNISARQLLDKNFVDSFRTALQETRIAPEWLAVELTETAVMTNGDRAIERLQQVRDMGISIAIDDFGTGYSSLSHLKRLPVDTLKIDRSFVEGLPADEEDRAIVTLIVSMANSLDYKIVVEGVETAAQLTFLTLCGCEYAQGYYFGEPMSADNFLQRLFAEGKVDSVSNPATFISRDTPLD
jgi:diguanylate cyclase (GGDEF)-like protein